MVERVLTREQFYAQYPNFAAMGWNDPQRQTWLAKHPGAAAQWPTRGCGRRRDRPACRHRRGAT